MGRDMIESAFVWPRAMSTAKYIHFITIWSQA